MNNWIKKLLETSLRPIIDESRSKLAADDKIYEGDKADLKELEAYYMNLDIADNDRAVIDDYIACMQTMNIRYADLSYIAGVRNTIEFLHGLNLLRDMDIEDKDINC
ncbi:hypothetical protein IMSAG049_00297 [Clostridiales bacterium]|nr:hypothetical protein IMSAG049_00297 [Clostridiales bacterium]